MWAVKRSLRWRASTPLRQKGVTSVEVALLSIVFFMIVFIALELARLMYVYNTLQEVTRRAAHELANTAPADPDSPSILAVRRRAIFQQTGDYLVFAHPITINHVRVDYQALVRDSSDGSLKRVRTSPLPSSAAQNRAICMSNPNDQGCIRFVRVRICEPGGDGSCRQVKYVPAFPMVSFDMNLPTSSTITPAESLGFEAGSNPAL